MSTDKLTQARAVVQRLSLREKLYLLNDLTMQVVRQSTGTTQVAPTQPLPSIHLDTWPSHLPLRREEL